LKAENATKSNDCISTKQEKKGREEGSDIERWARDVTEPLQENLCHKKESEWIYIIIIINAQSTPKENKKKSKGNCANENTPQLSSDRVLTCNSLSTSVICAAV
jgi:hypothetical protein